MVTEIWNSPSLCNWIDQTNQLIINTSSPLHCFTNFSLVSPSTSATHISIVLPSISPPPNYCTEKSRTKGILASPLLDTQMGLSSPFLSTLLFFHKISKGYNFWIGLLNIPLSVLWLNTCTSPPWTTSSLPFITLIILPIFQFLLLIPGVKTFSISPSYVYAGGWYSLHLSL